MRRELWILSLGLILSCWSLPASAQLKPKTLRFGLDVDILSAGAVWTKLDGQSSSNRTKVIAFGSGELGNSRVSIPVTPLGVSGDLVLRPHWMVGMRGGFGFDHLNAEGPGPDINAFSMSFMPDVTFVPSGENIKPFLKLAPILQFTQLKAGGERQHMFAGGFSAGGGSFFFLSNRSSVDLGAYFEARFGELKGTPAGSTDINDVRGVLRFGVSIWNYRKDRPVMGGH